MLLQSVSRKHLLALGQAFPMRTFKAFVNGGWGGVVHYSSARMGKSGREAMGSGDAKLSLGVAERGLSHG